MQFPRHFSQHQVVNAIHQALFPTLVFHALPPGTFSNISFSRSSPGTFPNIRFLTQFTRHFFQHQFSTQFTRQTMTDQGILWQTKAFWYPRCYPASPMQIFLTRAHMFSLFAFWLMIWLILFYWTSPWVCKAFIPPPENNMCKCVQAHIYPSDTSSGTLFIFINLGNKQWSQ